MLTFAEAQQHPHVLARQTFIEVDGIVQAAPTPRFSRSQCAMPERPHMAGEDTVSVLRSAGLSETDIAKLAEHSVVEVL